MFSIKERATLAANLVGSMMAGEGWYTSAKELVQAAEEILDEIEMVYKPEALAEELKILEEIRETEFFKSFHYLMFKHKDLSCAYQFQNCSLD